ncbi:hypothetical protein [Sinorhizobium meliloti]|uniref:hypothetical protein n=1 Tax=Rhizobium meliloti TaxID=382 RepID=UPI0003035B53|nr:hypothetical protein [Sinorhizobium meliloti]MCO5961972.1 hypothetical protein [Sinorhizobium meliloti]MDE4616631.1 hypothetical protein [Sinorhizobium meliloti]GEC37771.1 hypothetical protein EME01_18430 [Sinorhizobium meliloti]
MPEISASASPKAATGTHVANHSRQRSAIHKPAVLRSELTIAPTSKADPDDMCSVDRGIGNPAGAEIADLRRTGDNIEDLSQHSSTI